MPQPPPEGPSTQSVPRFYLTTRQPLQPGVILLAVLAAVGAVGGIVSAMSHSARYHFLPGASQNSGSASSSGSSSDDSQDDKDDDPNQIDTIVLGDPSEAPMPGRHGNHVSPVHRTIVIVLPRGGKDFGQIPNSAAGHLLYDWLAAFNSADSAALSMALPTIAPEASVAAQMALRRQTGGFYLLSAKEVEPGVLVFRLRDQTPEMTEALGTLQVRDDTLLPAVATFSVRAVPATPQPAGPADALGR